MSEFSHLSALVIGAGSIGRRHMKNLRELGIGRMAVVDPDAERLKTAAAEVDALPYQELEPALRLVPNVTLVCTPPSMHVMHALAALAVGSQVFIEKPLSNNAEEMDRLIEDSTARNATVHVGYNLRFIPGLVSLKGIVESGELGKPQWGRFEFGQYLPDWRPWQDYRKSYTARKELGGGIILDASHEIDLAMWLLGKPTAVCCMAGKTSALEMDVEDTATLLLRFESGAQADVHVDCVQREYSRGLKIAFEKGAATWSWPDNVLRISEVGTMERVIPPPKGYMANQMYVEELRVFLKEVVERVQSTSLLEGREVIRVALAASRSSDDRAWVEL